MPTRANRSLIDALTFYLKPCCMMARMGRSAAFFLLLLAPSSQAQIQALADFDHLRARNETRHGRYVPLESILQDAERRQPGRMIEVDLDMEEGHYEIEILRADGRVVELEYDARTGRFLGLELDDDD